MHALASFIMRGRMQATMVTVVSMVLSMVVPFLSYVSGGTVALVALRRGLQDTAYVVLGASFVVGVLSYMANGQLWLALVYVVGIWIPVALLGLVLRATVSMAKVVYVAAAMGALMIIGTYIVVQDPAVLWQTGFIEPFVATLAQLNPDAEVLKAQADLLNALASFMTGIVACAIVLGAVLNVFIGRWWQSILYNPGGFREEFYQLQLGKGFAMATVAMVAISFLPMGQVSAMARELAMLMVSIVALQGIALMHAMVALKNGHIAWLVGFYVLMFVALPQVMMVLALTALADMWLNLRGRLGGGGPAAGPPGNSND